MYNDTCSIHVLYMYITSIKSKYCTLTNFEEHTSRMKYETVWGTDLELRAAASYLRLPIYVCTQRSKTLEYYWECYKPLLDLSPPMKNFISDIPQAKLLGHLEICHRDRCHYDVVTMSDGLQPVSPPPLQNTTLYFNLT